MRYSGNMQTDFINEELLNRARGYKTFFILNSDEHGKFFAHISTVVGMSTFLAGKIAF